MSNKTLSQEMESYYFQALHPNTFDELYALMDTEDLARFNSIRNILKEQKAERNSKLVFLYRALRRNRREEAHAIKEQMKHLNAQISARIKILGEFLLKIKNRKSVRRWKRLTVFLRTTVNDCGYEDVGGPACTLHECGKQEVHHEKSQ